MNHANMNLGAILELERVESALFRGGTQASGLRLLFGGQLMGQSLVAAARTVGEKAVNSLHGYFLNAGNPNVDVFYRVEILREGKSYCTRRVTALQDDRQLSCAMLSFHAEEPGLFDHQNLMPNVPTPQELAAQCLGQQGAFARLPERVRRWYDDAIPVELPDRPIELRPVEIDHFVGEKNQSPELHYWIRPARELPDDPIVHAAALVYASDWALLDAPLARHGRTLFDEHILAASLDHAMWFHRPCRADQWLLYVKDSPSGGGGRALARGSIFAPDGNLVASVAQEGSLRERR